MMQPGLGAVIFLTLCIIVVFGIGAFLVYRVMNTPVRISDPACPNTIPTPRRTPPTRPTAVPLRAGPNPRIPAPTTPTSPESPDPGHRHP